MASASKGSPITSSNYQQKLECIKENGIINEVLNDAEDKEEVFAAENEETRSSSGSESNASTLEKGESAIARKKSVLKKGGDQRAKPILQKRVSFSSVPSERRRRVSSGRLITLETVYELN